LRGEVPLLGAVMATLARTLQREHASAVDTLAAVTTAVVAAVPGAEHAAISLIERRSIVHSHAATSEMARRLEQLQGELEDGPCLTATWEQQTVHITDMARETRWPRFAAAAAEAGVGAMLCFQLFVDGDNLGALNLYAPTAGVFDEESESIGLIFAAHAAVAIAGAHEERHLHAALAHRDIIGQAKGIVMERFHLDSPRAFTLLARLSQEQNRKLHDVAGKLVADVNDSATPASPLT
jgi:transcriptional regulator with GAF, ATPase, and Fis domain